MDFEILHSKLKTGLITPKILLSGIKLLDELSKDSPGYSDPKNFPFYYYLGRQVVPERVLQVGPQLGLPGATFLQGCKTVKEWFALDVFAPSISRSNLSLHCDSVKVAKLDDEKLKIKFSCDIGFISESFKLASMNYLEFVWQNLNPEGLLVVDYINDDTDGSFYKFCRVKNREPEIFDTRNRIGIIQK